MTTRDRLGQVVVVVGMTYFAAAAGLEIARAVVRGEWRWHVVFALVALYLCAFFAYGALRRPTSTKEKRPEEPEEKR